MSLDCEFIYWTKACSALSGNHSLWASSMPRIVIWYNILISIQLSNAIVNTILTSAQMEQNMCPLPKQPLSCMVLQFSSRAAVIYFGRNGEIEVIWNGVASSTHTKMVDIQINHAQMIPSILRRLNPSELYRWFWNPWQAEFQGCLQDSYPLSTHYTFSSPWSWMSLNMTDFIPMIRLYHMT